MSKKQTRITLYKSLIPEVLKILTVKEIERLESHVTTLIGSNVEAYIDHLFIDYFHYEDKKVDQKEMIKVIVKHIKQINYNGSSISTR